MPMSWAPSQSIKAAMCLANFSKHPAQHCASISAPAGCCDVIIYIGLKMVNDMKVEVDVR